VSVGVGLQRFTGRLVVEPGRVRFEPNGSAELTFSEPIRVTHHLLAPFLVNTDLNLGRWGAEEVVLTLNWFSSPTFVRALRAAGLDVAVRRRLF
jgi:hypothetical protein